MAILATLDTKTAEAGLMIEEIESLGDKALIIDIGVVGDAGMGAYVSRADVVAKSGGNLEGILLNLSSEMSDPSATEGSKKILTKLVKNN